MSPNVARSAFLAVAVVALLGVAPAAFGADGIGLSGRVDDKEVTFWGLALVIFFPLMVTVLSLIQGRLERRKEQRKLGLARFEAERGSPPVGSSGTSL